MKNHFQRLRKVHKFMKASAVSRTLKESFMITSTGTRKYLNLLNGEVARRHYDSDSGSMSSQIHFSAIGLAQYKRWTQQRVHCGLWDHLPDGYDEVGYAFDLCEMIKIATNMATGRSAYTFSSLPLDAVEQWFRDLERSWSKQALKSTAEQQAEKFQMCLELASYAC